MSRAAAYHDPFTGRFARPPIEKPQPRTQYRVRTRLRPRGPWRDSYSDAMQDAIDQDLASYDRSRREHYIAVPVSIETRMVDG